MNCPGSINLTAGLPNPSSKYAQEGTAAHRLAQQSLEQNVDASTFVGDILDGVEVTEDMAEHVQVYVDHCRKIMEQASEYWFERRFNLAALIPPAPMYGTADFTAYNLGSRTLFVSDLKYGKGVVVEADTPQTKYYGLGTALSLDPVTQPIDWVVLTIVQPRASHAEGPIRSITIPYSELVEFAGDLIERAHATQAPDAPLKAGSWCRFCPAAGICPAQRDEAQATAMVEFADMPLAVPPSPETLPLDVFVDILNKKHILESWIKALDARALAMLERGEDVPGFKLVERRATRKWTDEAAAVTTLLNAEELETDDIYEKPKLKSPPQIEKLYKGKKKFEAAMNHLVKKESSGYTMTRSTDPRPAVALTPGRDFDALPASTQANRQDAENEIE